MIVEDVDVEVFRYRSRVVRDSGAQPPRGGARVEPDAAQDRHGKRGRGILLRGGPGGGGTIREARSVGGGPVLQGEDLAVPQALTPRRPTRGSPWRAEIGDTRHSSSTSGSLRSMGHLTRARADVAGPKD